MKNNRHAKILEIIKEYDIETQEDLLGHLKKAGFKVTQATVSRNIKELKLAKIAVSGGNYKYAHSQHDVSFGAKFHSILAETVIKTDHAENILVIRTYAGMAQAAAAAIDATSWPEFVGSVAGDDTIIIILRTKEKAKEFDEKLRAALKMNG